MKDSSQLATAGKGDYTPKAAQEERDCVVSLTDLILRFNGHKRGDTRVKPSHIAIFMALAEAWNKQRRPENFAVEVCDLCLYCNMKQSNVYRILQELSEWGYIEYRHGTKGAGLPYFRFIIPVQWNGSGMEAESDWKATGMEAEWKRNGSGTSYKRYKREESDERKRENNNSNAHVREEERMSALEELSSREFSDVPIADAPSMPAPNGVIQQQYQEFRAVYPQLGNKPIPPSGKDWVQVAFMRAAGGDVKKAAAIVRGAGVYGKHIASTGRYVMSAQRFIEEGGYTRDWETTQAGALYAKQEADSISLLESMIGGGIRLRD